MVMAVETAAAMVSSWARWWAENSALGAKSMMQRLPSRWPSGPVSGAPA
jgi:hypothetical protein